MEVSMSTFSDKLDYSYIDTKKTRYNRYLSHTKKLL